MSDLLNVTCAHLNLYAGDVHLRSQLTGNFNSLFVTITMANSMQTNCLPMISSPMTHTRHLPATRPSVLFALYASTSAMKPSWLTPPSENISSVPPYAQDMNMIINVRADTLLGLKVLGWLQKHRWLHNCTHYRQKLWNIYHFGDFLHFCKICRINCFLPFPHTSNEVIVKIYSHNDITHLILVLYARIENECCFKIFEKDDPGLKH